MSSFGRGLQLLGLVLLPLAMVLEATGSLGRGTGVSDMIIMLIAGVCAFTLGRLIESYSRG